MDLWIRSQDRTTLIRSYEIYIAEHSNSYVIRAKRTSHILGAYRTIERALKVLDEIQRLISLDLLNENISYQEADIYLKTAMLDRMARIYEMPKE